MRPLKLILRCFLTIIALTSITNAREMSEPVMEYASVLSGLSVQHQSGRFELEHRNGVVTTVFLPPGAKVDVVLTKKGAKSPLHIQPLMISQSSGAFSRVETRGLLREFRITEPGEYKVTYRANSKPMTTIPFTAEFVSNDDLFDPKTHIYLNGPWNDWAYLFASVNAGPEANPKVRMWVS